MPMVVQRKSKDRRRILIESHKTPEEFVRDEVGKILMRPNLEPFALRPVLLDMVRVVQIALDGLLQVADRPGGEAISQGVLQRCVSEIVHEVTYNVPHEQCLCSDGATCPKCGGRKWMTQRDSLQHALSGSLDD